MGNLCCPDKIEKYCRSGEIHLPLTPPLKPLRKSYNHTDICTVWQSVVPRGIMEYLCPICRTNMMVFENRKTWEIAHIKAHSKGGSGDIDNLRPTCKDCNRKMKNNHMVEYCVINVKPELLSETLEELHLSYVISLPS